MKQRVKKMTFEKAEADDIEVIFCCQQPALAFSRTMENHHVDISIL